jgi:hypothetical protein
MSRAQWRTTRGHGFQQIELEVMSSAFGTNDLTLSLAEPIASAVQGPPGRVEVFS